MPISRSSTNLMREWNSSSVPDHRSQIGEELERGVGIIETSLNRFGMILDSVQSDIMQVHKGTKEVLIESMRQKLVANNNLLQLMSRGQEDVKTNLVRGIKSLSDQIRQNIYRERLKDISSAISALPEQIDACLQQLKSELCKTVIQEIQWQAIACSVKIPSQNHVTPTVLLAKGISRHSTPQQMPLLKNPEVHPKVCGKSTTSPKIEVGSWTSVKTEQATFSYMGTSKNHNQKRMHPFELEREWRIPIELDEEIDVGFSCLLEGNYSMAEAKEETERILMKARRRKRKHCNAIILD